VITGRQARDAARAALRNVPVRADPVFAPWTDASAGEPVVVHTVRGEASYWLVPVVIKERVAGFVRVNADGQVAAVGAYYRDPKQIAASPAVVTRITASEAAALAAKRVNRARGETAAQPVYVHDGPPGREAWMIEVSRAGRPTRWLFVTPGAVYERRAGTHQGSTVD
jgi:hypothetical protein